MGSLLFSVIIFGVMKLIGGILFLVARVLSFVVLPLGVVVGFVLRLLIKIGLRLDYEERTIDEDAYEMALALDKFGNGVCGPLFNLVLRRSGGYLFGDYEETISRCLGKNKRMGKLSWLGKIFSSILNFIDKDHVEKASED